MSSNDGVPGVYVVLGIAAQVVGAIILGGSIGTDYSNERSASTPGLVIGGLIVLAGLYAVLVGLIAAGVRLGNSPLLLALQERSTATSDLASGADAEPGSQPAPRMNIEGSEVARPVEATRWCLKGACGQKRIRTAASTCPECGTPTKHLPAAEMLQP